MARKTLTLDTFPIELSRPVLVDIVHQTFRYRDGPFTRRLLCTGLSLNRIGYKDTDKPITCIECLARSMFT